MTPTFFGDSGAMNRFSDTPSAFANLVAAVFTDVGSFNGYVLLARIPRAHSRSASWRPWFSYQGGVSVLDDRVTATGSGSRRSPRVLNW
jgi:hypothetical protein